MRENPTFTRRVNGNDAIKVGEELRELLAVDVGDYVTIEVTAVHRKQEFPSKDSDDNILQGRI